LGTTINFAYASLPMIAWYIPENPTTSKVRVLVRKFCTSPNVIGRLIYLRGSASIPGTTLWNGVVGGLSADNRIPISSSVDV
jgi:hypothetical protein